MKKLIIICILLSGCVAVAPNPSPVDAGTSGDASTDTSADAATASCRQCVIFADRTVCVDLNCNDGDPCTADFCDTKYGCWHQPVCGATP